MAAIKTKQIKVTEQRCAECYTKILQTGAGRRAKLCASCRKKRDDSWRANQKAKPKKEDKPINVVGGDNA